MLRDQLAFERGLEDGLAEASGARELGTDLCLRSIRYRVLRL
jgi:hypothetical protein